MPTEIQHDDSSKFVEFNGRRYLARGWLSGLTGEPGTILGPNTSGEYLVVLACDTEGKRVLLGFAQLYDMHALSEPMPTGPRSLTERKIIDGAVRSEN